MTFSPYGLLVGLGLAVFWLLFEWVLKENASLKRVSFTPAFLLVSLCSLVGARLYHLWTDWSYYSERAFLDLIAIWNGGLGIYGALAGGLLGFALWKRLFAKRASWLLLLDAAAFALPFGQAIGRWGNYVNNELFGLPSSLPWAIEIPAHFRPEEYRQLATFHPLFLYESMALLLVGGFLLLLRKRFAELFPLGTGWYVGCYLFAYGSIRFSLELLRVQSAPGWLGLTIAQWISLLVSSIGLLLFSRAFRLQWKVDEIDASPLPTSLSAPGGKRRSARRSTGARSKSR